jgi:hypothetical protein
MALFSYRGVTTQPGKLRWLLQERPAVSYLETTSVWSIRSQHCCRGGPGFSIKNNFPLKKLQMYFIQGTSPAFGTLMNPDSGPTSGASRLHYRNFLTCRPRPQTNIFTPVTAPNSSARDRTKMSTDEELPIATTDLKADISIWKRVNEARPCDEILSAHHVARLTRHHRRVLSAMAALRRLPRNRRFDCRAVGGHAVSSTINSRKPKAQQPKGSVVGMVSGCAIRGVDSQIYRSEPIGFHECAFPRKRILTKTLDIRYKLLIYKWDGWPPNSRSKYLIPQQF